MSMLQIIISGTVMIIIAIVIRTLAMDRVPKITFVAIWGIVTARLLIPFSIPLPFNLWNVFNRTSISVNNTQDTTNTISPSANELVPVATLPLDRQPTIMALQAESNNNWLMGALIGAWIAGTLISIAYFLVGHYKFRRKIGDSLPVDNEFVHTWLKENKLIRPIQVRQSYKIISPLTYGIFRPVILVPEITDWQDETQLNYIFAHEYIHIKRFDYALKTLFALTFCIHWFNPFVWVMYTLSNRDIELACDEAVLQHFGLSSKKSYALTLLNMEEKRSQYSLLNNNFSRNFLEERIEVMIRMKRKSIFGAALALTLVIGVMAVLAASGESHTYPPTPIAEASNGEAIPVEPIASRFEGILVDDIVAAAKTMDPDNFTEWVEQRDDMLRDIIMFVEWSHGITLEEWMGGLEEHMFLDIVSIATDFMDYDSFTEWMALHDNVVIKESVGKTMDYDSFIAWKEQRLDEMANSGDFSEETIELFREDYSKILNDIRDGVTVTIHEDMDNIYSMEIGDHWNGEPTLMSFSADRGIMTLFFRVG